MWWFDGLVSFYDLTWSMVRCIFLIKVMIINKLRVLARLTDGEWWWWWSFITMMMMRLVMIRWLGFVLVCFVLWSYTDKCIFLIKVMIFNKLRVLALFKDGERWWWWFDDLKRKIISWSWSIFDVSCYDIIFYASTNQIGGALLLMREKCSSSHMNPNQKRLISPRPNQSKL